MEEAPTPNQPEQPITISPETELKFTLKAADVDIILRSLNLLCEGIENSQRNLAVVGPLYDSIKEQVKSNVETMKPKPKSNKPVKKP